MLVNKFKLKYGNKASLSKFIENEVTRFLNNNRLTEDQLKNLDSKISKEANNRDRKEAALDDHKSNRSASVKAQSVAAAAANMDDVKSVKSNASRTSSQARQVGGLKKDADQLSHLSAAKTEVYS